jgi:predicted nucleic acid-binding protein
MTESRALIAPDIMPVEAANAWWKKVRRGEMAAVDLEEALGGLLGLGLMLAPTVSLLERSARTALEIRHPVYDCVYLSLAAERGASLATADDRLRRAAERMRIALWRPAGSDR